MSGRRGWIGRGLKRVEDERLLRGLARHVDDLAPAECLHMVFLRSPHARARIAGLDLDAARAAPGVVALVTGEDVAGIGPLSVNPLLPDARLPPSPILPRAEVHAVGQPVVAVIANTVEAAQEAAELIEPRYVPATPVLAGAEGGASLHDEVPENRVFVHRWRGGNPEAAFAAADAVVSVELLQPRLAPTPLEPRTALAAWDGATLTFWTSSQTPHRARSELARALGLEPARVRVIAPDVGGAFGAKASLSREDVVLAWAARRLGRTVKWIATRSEELLSATHGRGSRARGALAVARDGQILALRAEFAQSLGHFLPYSALAPSRNAGRILPGPYRVAAVSARVEGRIDNAAPVGIYRGAGRPEAALLMERLIDLAARRLGIDPVEMRRRNLLSAVAMPHRSALGETLDSGDPAALLERICRRASYPRLRRQQEARRARGELVGIGLACFVEPCGQGWESARITIDAEGGVVAALGTSGQGQGQRTIFAQIVADGLGVSPASVRVVQGDTSETPEGIGALASRSTAIGGSAALRAARELRERGRGIAASLWGAPMHEVIAVADGFALEGRPQRLRWPAIAQAAHARAAAQGHNAPPLEAQIVYTAPGETWSQGCCLALVSIDGETGTLEVERIFWADDAGILVNPLLAEGQMLGGLAQGLGQAVMERIVYDGEGQLLTGTLLDYALPRAADIPPVSFLRSTSAATVNALGAKGVGESGCIGVPAAIVNAALDALGPLGIEHLDLPLTSERLWRAIEEARKR